MSFGQLILAPLMFTMLIHRSIAALLCIFFLQVAKGQTCISQSDGNWNTAATWLCDGVARVPTCNDTIEIASATEVTVTNQNDYSGCSGTMALDVHGTLTFTSGNKVRLPCGSLVSIQTGGTVRKSGSGGGTSTLISICGTEVWKAADGQLDGPVSFGGFILPVELISFEVSSNEQGTIVSWSTASEIDNDRFEILTSIDSENWTVVRIVEGAGNSNVQLDYKEQFDNPFDDGTLVRLSQVDFDGTTSLSEIAVVEQPSDMANRDLKIFPIPVEDRFTVEGEEITGVITITDPLGRSVYSQEVNETGRLSLSADELGLQPGLYYLGSSSGRFQTMPFLVH